MHFSNQMMAVLQVIWGLRQGPPGSENRSRKGTTNFKKQPKAPPNWKPGDKRKLNELAVERKARELLIRQASPGEKSLTVARASWRGCENAVKGKKVIWFGIKRAIDGLDPLPEHSAIDEQIERFGNVDEAHILSELNQRLMKEVDEKDKVIRAHKEEFKAFQEKAYTIQFVDSEYRELINENKKNHETAKLKLVEEVHLRQKLDLEARALRDENKRLKRITLAIGESRKTGKKPNVTDFSLNLSDLPADTDNLLLSYYRLRDVAWDQMIHSVGLKAPDYFFLVFHKFNVDVNQFISSTINFLPGATNYVFACHQPSGSKRERWFETISNLVKIPPAVFLIEGSLASDSKVTPLRPNKNDIQKELYELVSKNLKNDDFNPMREGFRQVWIDRVTNE